MYLEWKRVFKSNIIYTCENPSNFNAQRLTLVNFINHTLSLV